MKKIILGAASVLSLALFSFAPSSGNVWRLADGNYRIETGAGQRFAPHHKTEVRSLMSQIYGRQFNEETVVAPMRASDGCNSILDYKASDGQIEWNFTKWNDCASYQVGSPQHRLVAIIDTYAQ